MRAPTWVALGLAFAAGGAGPVGSAGVEASGPAEGTESAVVTQSVEDASPPRTSPAPLSRRDTEVLASTLADARAKVAALVAQAQGTPPGPELDALQAAIVRSKLDAQMSFLRLQIEMARRVGDDERAVLAARVLEAYSAPSRVPPDAPPPTPDKGRPEGGKP